MKRSIKKKKKRITGTQPDWEFHCTDFYFYFSSSACWLLSASFVRAVAARWQQATAEQLQNASCIGGWQDVEWRSESATEEDEMLSALFRRHCFYPGSCLGRGPAVGGGSGSLLKLADQCSAALTRPPAPVGCRVTVKLGVVWVSLANFLLVDFLIFTVK